MIHALVALQMLAQRAGDRIHEQQEGATAVEYGLLVALIAAVIVTIVALLGKQVREAFAQVSCVISGGTWSPGATTGAAGTCG